MQTVWLINTNIYMKNKLQPKGIHSKGTCISNILLVKHFAENLQENIDKKNFKHKNNYT